MSVRLISITPNAEKIIAYCARVSNPAGQDRDDFAGLLKYCVRNKHWSIFEHAHLTVEITCSLAIATQLLRHRSFTFQQFSQRYATAGQLDFRLHPPSLRSQDSKNRQNSIDDLSAETKAYFNHKIEKLFHDTQELYNEMLSQGVAKECARFILPQATTTRLYMTGNIRDWFHYIQLRTGNGTQLEHCEIANQIREIFREELPIISQCL